MDKLLAILEKDSTLSAEQMAVMLGEEVGAVREKIEEYRENKTILGYKTIIDWEKTDRELVSAIIELKVTPQRGEGFDKVAERIYQYSEVTSVYLMSGGFDITVVVEGKGMKEVALFVAEKLAPMESVVSTATHFVLKKYKIDGVVVDDKTEDTREVITL